jgi:hypothetical protein
MDLRIDDRRRSRLSFGMHAAQQRRSSRGEHRPRLYHDTPVDKPISAG